MKLFFKTVYGNNEYYPEQVKWFSVKLGKEKAGKETSMDMAEYLEEEEIQKIIECAPTLQKRAFLACMYESGARPEEFLRLTNFDIRIDSMGAVFMLRGKTGERRVRIKELSRQLNQKDEQLDQELDDAIKASFDEIDQEIESDKKLKRRIKTEG